MAIVGGSNVIILDGPTGPAGVTGPAGSAGKGYLATSSTTLALTLGVKTLATQQGLAYLPGTLVRLTSQDDAADWLEGAVASYVGTELVVDATRKGGFSANATGWNISVIGDRGATGPIGPTGPAGAPSVTLTGATGATAELLRVVTASPQNNEVPVLAFWQRFPRKSEIDKFLDGEDCSISNATLRVLTAARSIFPLRQRDRFVDSGTGQVRSRDWLDDTRYVRIGETGDACAQCWFTGYKGIKTATAATSALRIPNAYINPDGAFTLTFRVAMRPGNQVAYKSLFAIGSMHAGPNTHRICAVQNNANEDATQVPGCAGDLTTTSLASFVPVVYSVVAEAGAAGAVRIYRNGVEVATGLKWAGAIFADDHAISGWWNNAAGTWWSYGGTYIFDVIIHDSALTAQQCGDLCEGFLPSAETVSCSVLMGQSNAARVAGVVANPPKTPNHTVASCDSSVNGQALGWRPSEPTAGVLWGTDIGIAPHIPSSALCICAVGGHRLNAFFDWTAPDHELVIESMLRAIWQLGARVSVQHIFMVIGESDAQVNTDAATKQAEYVTFAQRWRRGFHAPGARIVVARLNADVANAVGGYDYVTEVRAAQVGFVAADANARLVNTDTYPLESDHLHRSANNRVLVGNDMGEAAVTT